MPFRKVLRLISNLNSNRASFGSALNMYYTTSRGIAREILHVVLFVARGAPTDVIKEDSLARFDTIHTMLRLANDQALILQGHPLLGEYQAPAARYSQVPVTPSASFLRKAKGL